MIPLAVAACWIGSFTLSCRLAALPAQARPDGAPDASLADLLANEARSAAGAHFYRMADQYFHRGVENTHARALEQGFFVRAADVISPRHHVHRHGAGIKEIMPWLQMAIMANPHDVETYLVAAFWLASEAHRPDVAARVLHEARRRNPESYEVELELGRLALSQGRFDTAVRCLDTALTLWPGTQSAESAKARQDKAAALLYRGLIHEARDEQDQAVRDLKEHLALFPGRRQIRDRIQAIQSGEEPSSLALQFLNDILVQHRESTSGHCLIEEEHAHHSAGDPSRPDGDGG